MKKLLFGMAAAMLLLALTACGDDSTNEKEEKPAEKTNASNEESNTADKEKETNGQDVEESELGKMTIIYKNKEIDENTESGPMKLNVSAVQLANLEVAEGQEYMFDEKNKVTVVTVQMKAENTVDDTMAFYPDQATLTTDTGDQIESEMLLSDAVGGDFFGKVKKEGNVIFLLDTPAEDIGEINLIINGAHSDDFSIEGEKIKLTIPTK